MQSGLHQQAAGGGVAAPLSDGKLRLNAQRDARWESSKLPVSSAKRLYLAEANRQMGKSRGREGKRGREEAKVVLKSPDKLPSMYEYMSICTHSTRSLIAVGSPASKHMACKRAQLYPVATWLLHAAISCERPVLASTRGTAHVQCLLSSLCLLSASPLLHLFLPIR